MLEYLGVLLPVLIAVLGGFGFFFRRILSRYDERIKKLETADEKFDDRIDRLSTFVASKHRDLRW